MFIQKVNPKTQVSFAANPQKAVMGDYPTLTDICIAYGKTFAEQWLYPQITDLTIFTGARNLNKEQVRELASVIAIEYRYLKVTELLIFFYRFKTGHYGRFYGSVDPMVITCALREFVKERNEFIDTFEREQRDMQEKSDALNPGITREEYLELIKSQNHGK